MKMNKIILIIILAVIFIACKKDYRYLYNELLAKKNCAEQLLSLDIEIDSLPLNEFYQTSSADTAFMIKVDELKTKQLLYIMDEVKQEHYQITSNLDWESGLGEGVIMPPLFETVEPDTIYQKVFVCGRLKIHPNIVSLVILRTDSINDYSDACYYLVNLKDNEVKSLVYLSTTFSMKRDIVKNGTTYENGQFVYFDRAWDLSPVLDMNSFIRNLIYRKTIPYARYRIDENGFVQTIDD